MFSRLARLIKSWFGFFITYAEDPEVMLQESIEEMRNTMPRLNQILVTTRATVLRTAQRAKDWKTGRIRSSAVRRLASELA
jgi:phage shock protein A